MGAGGQQQPGQAPSSFNPPAYTTGRVSGFDQPTFGMQQPGGGFYGGNMLQKSLQKPWTKDANEPEPTTVPWATSAPPAAAPGAAPGTPPGTAPATPGGAGTTPRADGGGPLNIWRPNGFYATPFNQTYGGQASPYADDGAQLLDSWRMADRGAGRFQNNMARRFAFQGGTPQWQPDAMTPGQPIGQQTYAPRAPFQPPAQPQVDGQQGAPQQSVPPKAMPGTGGAEPKPGGAIDHAANFNKLFEEDPRMAYQYGIRGGPEVWNSMKGNLLQNQFGGDLERYNQFVNDSDRNPLSEADRNRLNAMKGIVPGRLF
jgi:hypothetical protein